jgi:hypothetical protein
MFAVLAHGTASGARERRVFYTTDGRSLVSGPTIQEMPGDSSLNKSNHKRMEGAEYSRECRRD